MLLPHKFFIIFLVSFAVFSHGCSTTNNETISSLQFENKRLEEKVVLLQGDIDSEKKKQKDYLAELEAEKALSAELRALKEDLEIKMKGLASDAASLSQKVESETQKATSLEKAKSDLEAKLQKEIADFQAKLEITERGLVVSFLAEILFDSGSSEILSEAYSILDKVSSTLSQSALENKIAIEGHTDNEPIKFSDWESNWELSAARALSVLHYFVDEREIDPERFSAIAYGEFEPREANATEEGRRQNRRVEIVILPKLDKQ